MAKKALAEDEERRMKRAEEVPQILSQGAAYVIMYAHTFEGQFGPQVFKRQWEPPFLIAHLATD